MKTIAQSTSSRFYQSHRYGLQSTKLFEEIWDQNHFLTLMIQHLLPETQPIAYCILPNSYNILLYVPHCQDTDKILQQYVIPMETGYLQYLERKRNRKKPGGNLFEGEIVPVQPEYLKRTICQIHQQPVAHQFCDHPVQWSYSSYASILRREPLLIDPFLTSNLFGGIRNMKEAHMHHPYSFESPCNQADKCYSTG